jgi:hypothetical protein
MRIKQSRLEEIFFRKRVSEKDKEGSSYETWGAAFPVMAEIWLASGKVQAQQYGERLSYIRNVRLEGDYIITGDAKGRAMYKTTSGLNIQEGDGICLYVNPKNEPDYRIISIKPYRPLKMEIEKI